MFMLSLVLGMMTVDGFRSCFMEAFDIVNKDDITVSDVKMLFFMIASPSLGFLSKESIFCTLLS
jgi:hypothetical protein